MTVSSGLSARIRARCSSASKKSLPAFEIAQPLVSRITSLSPNRLIGPAKALRARIRVDHSRVDNTAKSLFKASKLASPSGYDESTLSMAMFVVMFCRQPSARHTESSNLCPAYHTEDHFCRSGCMEQLAPQPMDRCVRSARALHSQPGRASQEHATRHASVALAQSHLAISKPGPAMQTT